MEILEAILKYFTDNSATLINIMLPILISFFVTMFFRKKDKKDNDARNLRAELREYFLTNCKPVIDDIVDDSNQKFRKYVYLIDKNDEPLNKEDRTLSIIELQKYFKNHLTLTFKLPQKFTSLPEFAKNLSHKKYEKRFNNYFYIISHIAILYSELIYFQIMNPCGQKESLIKSLASLIIKIDLILEESELILFNNKFNKDRMIFQNYIDTLDKAVLDTGLDNAKDFLFNREKFKKTETE